MKVTVYDYKNREVEVELPVDSISDITAVYVRVLSGDETGYIVFKNGKSARFDSSDCRRNGSDDGDYELTDPKLIKMWVDYNPNTGERYSYIYPYDRQYKIRDAIRRKNDEVQD